MDSGVLRTNQLSFGAQTVKVAVVRWLAVLNRDADIDLNIRIRIIYASPENAHALKQEKAPNHILNPKPGLEGLY